MESFDFVIVGAGIAGAAAGFQLAGRALAPVPRPERTAGGVFDPLAMDIDVHALHHGFPRGEGGAR